MICGQMYMAAHKYGARAAVCRAGHRHASRKEARRCDDLHLLAAVGEITQLRIAPQYGFCVNGVPRKYCGSNRRLKYVADFSYINRSGGYIVEDVKGVKTPAYKIKKALMKALNGIDVFET